MSPNPVRALFRPGFPIRPDRFPFFYGWVVLVVGIFGILMSAPGQTVGVGAFTDPLIEATGLTRLEFANAYLIGTITSGFLLPFGGRLIDRLGVRMLAVTASFMLAGTLVYLSASDRIARALTAIPGGPGASTAAFLVLVVGFTFLRFSGQGMLTMVSHTMLGKWFERRRGQMAAIAGVFVSFGFALTPLVLVGAIERVGWREVWFSLALIVGVGMSLVGWLFYRDNPEECGLRMDGAAAPAPGEAERPDPRAVRDFTRAEALRTRGFWAVNLALTFHALVITGVTFHIVDIGAEAGLDPVSAASIFLPIAAVSTVTGYLVGVASDRVRLRWLLVTMMVFQATGLAALTQYGTLPGRALAILGVGVSAGFFGPLGIIAFPRFFGRAHLGAINGVKTSSFVIGSALGPSILALSHSLTGSYTGGLLACLVLPASVAVLAWGAVNPQDRYRARAADDGRIVVTGRRVTTRR